jgi:Methyltransferase domain.
MADINMLSFYSDHSVAPVRQNIADLDGHFYRRRVLYQQLGIGAGAFTGRHILEVGPGTGQNALFVAAQRPSQLVLVEPNPTGVEEIKNSFKPYPAWCKILSVQNVPIEQYLNTHQFDFVLCEGLVGASGHPDPTALILSIADHVRIDGILVLTCIEYVAYLSEMLRRLLGVEITGHLQDINQRTAALLPIFSSHLQSLPGMSRRFDDWVIDNLINPASVGRLVSFADCLSELGNKFDMLSTSPRFITDWAWYKKAALDINFFNQVALECYWHNLHNFMDYRCVSPPRLESENRSLSSRCEESHHQIREYERTRNSSVRQQIIANLHMLQQEISATLPMVAGALAEVEGWLLAPSIDLQAVANSEKFGTWFGRAATYLSLIRRI